MTPHSNEKDYGQVAYRLVTQAAVIAVQKKLVIAESQLQKAVKERNRERARICHGVVIALKAVLDAKPAVITHAKIQVIIVQSSGRSPLNRVEQRQVMSEFRTHMAVAVKTEPSKPDPVEDVENEGEEAPPPSTYVSPRVPVSYIVKRMEER